MSAIYPFTLTITGEDEAQDIAQPILEDAAYAIRKALIAENVWAEIEIAGDGISDTY